MCIASKIKETIKITKKALQLGKSVVIGLQSTGEAQAFKNIDNRNDFEIGSTAYGVLNDLFKKLKVNIPDDSSESLKEIHLKIEYLKKDLPPNSLDLLIDKLGGPNEVAEMTGRKSHITCDDTDEDDGSSLDSRKRYKFRDRDVENIDERQYFMSDKKKIAIISDATSCGISLHACKDSQNQRKRLHITLGQLYSHS